LAFIAIAAAAQEGAMLFQKHCSYCHGAGGEGGRGPDLASGRFQHARNDEELFLVIRNGVRGTEMPAVRATVDEVRALMAYVRSLRVRGEKTSSGDAAAGERLFAQCAGCHPAIGPDLRTSSFRGAAFIRDSIVKPEAEIAAGFRAIIVTAKDGVTVSGIRLNEDDVSVQLRTADGALHSLLKAGVVSIDRSRPSLMPAFAGRLTEKQIDDLTAYVMGMR